MATVPHVTSGSGLRKFQADGFLFDRVYTLYSGASCSDVAGEVAWQLFCFNCQCEKWWCMLLSLGTVPKNIQILVVALSVWQMLSICRSKHFTTICSGSKQGFLPCLLKKVKTACLLLVRRAAPRRAARIDQNHCGPSHGLKNVPPSHTYCELSPVQIVLLIYNLKYGHFRLDIWSVRVAVWFGLLRR